jgi:transglutaminase-like putative cysteine protease
MSQQSSFRRLTIYFGLFATIAAGLVGLGQGSWNLPILVALASVVSVLYTDILGWFYLPRFFVYLGMIGGAVLAIQGFLNDENPNRLLSVGNLLVYVQLPLMFQKKSKRVYEQWGVFLLLELVVAALVNDNVLYGVIMLPVLAIGCAALMGLALFASYLRHNESFPESTSLWARWLHWLGKEQLVSRRSSGVTLSASQNSSFGIASTGNPPTRWRSSIIPTAFATLLFSVGYFYMLPRLHSGAFEGEGFGWGGSKIGFSDQISLQYIGKVLQNSSPAFRMSMAELSNGAPYRPNTPPYIRATVVHRYVDGPGQGVWQPGDFRGAAFGGFQSYSELPLPGELDREISQQQDAVVVQVIEKSPFGDVVSALPPFARTEKSPFRSVRRDWRIVDPRENAMGEVPPKRRYSFITYAFQGGQDSPFLADMADCYEDKQSGTLSQYDGELTRFPQSLKVALPVMERILATSPDPLTDKLSKALYLENYLSNNEEFEYSLTLTGPVNRSLDPIADFLINKKSGHCQFFASSLALLLRSMDIPTRLVIGFRPSEYNMVGNYFPVLQNHAHVWVEAFFPIDEIQQGPLLERARLQLPRWATQGVWLRLDPTPAVEGSNAGGSFRVSTTQTLDAMQDLWTEMVMNMDKNKQGTIFSLFGESSEGSYVNIWLQLQSLLTRMQSSRFIGGFLSPDRWFSWRIALLIVGLGAVALALWRGFPMIFDGLGFSGPTKKKRRIASASRVEYYERAARLLKKLGLRREPHETPRAFLRQASRQLQAIGIQIDDTDLTDPFYARRFGQAEREEPDQQLRIQRVLENLELAVRENGRRKLQQS